MLLLLCRGASAKAMSSDVTMGDASRIVGNVMEVPTVQMEATRLLRHVPKTAPRDTSNATVVNASLSG